MSQNIDRLIKKDADVVLHPASSITALLEDGPQMIVEAKGCNVIDSDGRELLDAVAS